MAPTDEKAYEDFHKTGKRPVHYPPFNPFIYSLENCVPLVKLGQDDRWQIDPNPLPRTDPQPAHPDRWVRFAYRLWFACDDIILSPTMLRGVRYALILLGWILASYFVAALSGSIKSD